MSAPALVDPLLVMPPRLRRCVLAHRAAGPFIPPKPVTPREMARTKEWQSAALDAAYWPVEGILRVCADLGGFTIRDLLSPRRTALLAKARHIACWLIRRFTTLSLPQIGRRLGDRDHTTVLHACRRADGAILAHDILIVEDPARMARILWAANWRVVRR